MHAVYELQRFFYLWTTSRNKVGYFISLWTSFDIILHSLPGNPNYFAISLKSRLTSLTGIFSREKILSRLTYSYIFLVFWIVRRGELPRIIEEKFAIFNSHRCCNEIFIASFFAHRRRKEHSSIRANQGTPAKKNTAKSKILKFRLFAKHIDAIWYLRREISFDSPIERKKPIDCVVKL